MIDIGIQSKIGLKLHREMYAIENKNQVIPVKNDKFITHLSRL